MTHDASWLRLPPISLVFFFIKGIQQLVKQGYQMIPGLVSIWVFAEPVRVWIPWILAAGVLLFAVVVFLRYLRFRYQVTPTRVQVKQGVLKRSELSLDMDRIQQADIQLPWYLRPFDLRVVRLESAGSKGQEVVLVGLTEARALAIKEAVQSQVKEVATPANSESNVAKPAAEATSVQLEIKLPLKEVLKIGWMQNPFLVASLIIGFVSSNDFTREYIEAAVKQHTAQFENIPFTILAVAVFVLLVLLLVLLGSTLLMTNAYYDYKLERRGQRYSYSAGLLSKLNRSFSVRKLQGIVVRQGLAALMVRRFNIELAQAGGLAGKKERFIVPALTVEHKTVLMNDLQVPEVHHWLRLHPWSITRWLLLPSVLVGAFVHLWAGAGVFVVLLALNILGWRKRGWYLNGQWFATRKGLLGSTERWLPVPKMQHIKWRQGPIQKRLGIGHLNIYSASVNYRLKDIPAAQAEALQAALVDQTRACQLRWM